MLLRAIINGKKAGADDVRAAIFQLREAGFDIEVRVTWEGGDAARLINEAIREGVTRLLIGGGDGSVNEAVGALISIPDELRPELAILPLGTANDFASACGIPAMPVDAVRLALEGTAKPVDAIKANELSFINVASAGFGAKVTAETPVALKNFLGGGAYTLMGLIKSIDFKPYGCSISSSGMEIKGNVIVGALCNGRQAGGGQVLAPKAKINDGLMDVVAVLEFPATDLDIVITELMNNDVDGQYVRRFRVEEMKAWSDTAMPINLDGEPYTTKNIDFKVLRHAIQLVVPDNCPLI